MSAIQVLAREFRDHGDIIAKTLDAVAEPFATLVSACCESVRSGGKIIFFGNGGSAADAQHLATELTVRYRKDRPAIAALALTTDSSALTAIGNDFSFDDLFSRQVEALARAGDIVIGISTSGNSPNVVKALEKAKAQGCVVAGFTGHQGGKMTQIADPLIVVPSPTTARIQEMHILIGHALCESIEIGLGYA